MKNDAINRILQTENLVQKLTQLTKFSVRKMKIEEYLRLLESNSVEELESSLLMQDNFPVVLKTDISILVKNILLANQFIYLKRYVPHPQKENPERKKDRYIHLFEHRTGTQTQMIPWISLDFPNV